MNLLKKRVVKYTVIEIFIQLPSLNLSSPGSSHFNPIQSKGLELAQLSTAEIAVLFKITGRSRQLP